MALPLAAAVLACRAPRAPADLVIRNATVYTMNPALPAAQALAVLNGRIVFVGSDSGVREWMGPGTEIVDGKGGMLLPGLIDSHVHPVSGVKLIACDLTADTSAAQVAETLKGCVAAHPEAPWVRGTGWQLPVFPHASPRAALLDSIVSDRPAFITAADGHSAWVNTRALTMAGITDRTPDPPNGRIERDALGVPTGTLRESAMDLLDAILPPYTQADYIAAYTQAFTMANSFGITAIIEANADSAMLDAYRFMDSSGAMTVRVTAAQQVDLEKGPGQVPRLERLRERVRGRMLEANSAKIFADGVIESGTAALLEPYLNHPGDRGTPNIGPDSLNQLVVALDRSGFQVHVHAIGDRAIRMSLDAFDYARKVNGVRDSRHIIAHLELIDPADIPRFKALSVIADFQPLWAYKDSYIRELTEPVLGPSRSRWLYPIASVLKTGATVVGGSDWSVSSMNPFEAIQVAVTRQDPAATAGAAWIPEEIIDAESALKAYTSNGAYARFADSTTGSLQVGKFADLVLIDRNILAVPAHQIADTRVVLTVLEGKIVYRSEQQP
ncbi:MAG: amidohydrolase [Gemmatimonadota bacterium]